jgi:hypothetical protein
VLADMSPEARSEMGAAGRDYVAAEHNFDSLVARLEALIEAPSPRR